MATATTFTLVDGYDRKRELKHTYRYMTLAEAKALGYGDHIEFIARDGTARRCKVNGQAKTWKRTADRVEVPIKYGMYEYTTFALQYDGRIGNSVATAVVRLSDDVEPD